jgi:UrcA family protein
MLRSNIRRICLAAGGAILATGIILAATIAPAFARQRDVIVTAHRDVPTRIVKYGDLNLAAEAGRKQLIHRVSWAVNEVCDINGTQMLHDAILSSRCRAFAWEGAKPQIETAFQRARFNQALLSSASIAISAR